MYVPPHFEQNDNDALHDFIERHSFGLMASTLSGGIFASHLPFLLNRQPVPFGELEGHMAKANPQWQQMEGQEVLVVFSGPHAYISPTWYEADNVVPTWNYVAVHAYGLCRLVQEPASVADILGKTVERYERGMPRPWTVDRSTDFFAKLAAMVVGFRVDITRLEGKWKLNQNHPQERRDKVARVLARSADQDAREIGRLMSTGRGQ